MVPPNKVGSPAKSLNFGDSYFVRWGRNSVNDEEKKLKKILAKGDKIILSIPVVHILKLKQIFVLNLHVNRFIISGQLKKFHNVLFIIFTILYDEM